MRTSDTKRDKSLKIYLTADEKEAIKKKAEKTLSLSMSEYARMVLLRNV